MTRQTWQVKPAKFAHPSLITPPGIDSESRDKGSVGLPGDEIKPLIFRINP
jgi:hypothetical protein